MIDFDEYIKDGNPSQREKSLAWKAAIGLQDVDGLKTSGYLLEKAKENIEGDITIDEVKHLIDSYYQSRSSRRDDEQRTEEADKVSARITEILTESAFVFSPAYLSLIHRRLFTGIFSNAGEYRQYNITKKEWVLDGDTVTYSPYEMIAQTLEYDFREEKQVDYSSLGAEAAIERISDFISGIWQIHPFSEGNTRTTSVFAIKYLRNFGFTVDNELFADNSWYFRNALVRANYSNFSKGVKATDVFLVRFLQNLILGTSHQLRNRDMHIFQSATEITSKCQNVTLDVTLNEMSVLELVAKNPSSTQEEIASHIGKSTRTVKRIMASLSDKGLLRRENGKRNGKWVVVETGVSHYC
ncbi:MAG: Fic family protein [Candidatus Cryptobacteroides sp.]